MQTRSDLQSEAFLSCCFDFERLANNYLISREKKSNNPITAFFTSRSVCDDVSLSLLESIRKITFSIDFPYVKHSARELFLEKCSAYYKQLTNSYYYLEKNKQSTKDLANFGREFSLILKRIAYITIGGEFESSDAINLNYLDYYLDQITTGSDCDSNDFWLKGETSALLSNYIARFPNSDVTKIIVPLLDSIENDMKGINKYAQNNKEKLDNLLNFINTFCLLLIDINEKELHSDISHIIYRAEDIDANFSIKSSSNPKKQGSSKKPELIGLVKLR